MTGRAAQWTIWLLLYCTAPVPYTLGAIETAPALRLTFFSTLIVGARLTEGAGGWIWDGFVALAVGQCVLYGAGLWLVASFVSRVFARTGESTRARSVLAIAAIVVLTVSVVPVYETPISSSTAHSTLLEILR